MKWLEVLILFIVAFIPPIIYAIWIRNTEKYNRERWIPIFVCFIWGSTIAVIAAVVLEFVLGVSLAISIRDGNVFGLITAIVIAPFAEELTKPIALRTRTVKRELVEFEDGLIYGAVAGLGFSATENLLYGAYFFHEGIVFFLVLMLLRSFSGCLLHASATALTGYGYGKSIIQRTPLLRVIPFFILAIVVHALYNLLVSFQMIGVATGLFLALAFVTVMIYLVRKKIRTLDGSR